MIVVPDSLRRDRGTVVSLGYDKAEGQIEVDMTLGIGVR